MNKFDYRNSNYVVSQDVSLEEAMQVITLNQRGAVIAVDDKGTLLGVLTDGDIRRAVLRGATLVTPISKLINMNVVSLPNKDRIRELAEEIFRTSSTVNIVPVVDSTNNVVDVIVRNPSVRKEL